MTFCDENHEYMDDFVQTSFLNLCESLFFFESERILVNFTKKMIFDHILGVKVVLNEIGKNKKLIIIEMIKK